MRKPIEHFVKICAEQLPLEGPVYEFGSLQVNNRLGYDLRRYFHGLEYLGADMRHGLGVDVILNLHDIELPSDSVGTVLCMDTLEHVEHPRQAMREIHRILRPNGIAVISSVFDFPIHNFPNDYWRFTPEGFRSLLKGFSGSIVDSYGKSEVSPQTIVGIGYKGPPPQNLDEFQRELVNWSSWYSAICHALSAQKQDL